MVDRRQLCIDPGKAAWALYVDVYVLDAGGWVTGWGGGCAWCYMGLSCATGVWSRCFDGFQPCPT